MQLKIQYSGWGKIEMSLFVSVLHSLRSWEFIHMFSLFLTGEKSWSKKISLGSKPCHPGGGVMLVKSNCFSSYSLQWVQFFFFFFFTSIVFWNPSARNRPSTKALSSSIFQRLLNHGWEEVELLHRPLQSPQPAPTSVCLSCNTRVCKTPLRYHGMWC